MGDCCDICNHCAWKLDDLAEQLARVTAERDAAKSANAELIRIYETEIAAYRAAPAARLDGAK